LLERQQRASGAQRLKNAFDSPWKLRFLTFAQITKKRMARHARTQLHLLFSQLGVFFFSNRHGHHYEMSEPILQGESPNSERLGRTSWWCQEVELPFWAIRNTFFVFGTSCINETWECSSPAGRDYTFSPISGR
jgi:hypothetical protein